LNAAINAKIKYGNLTHTSDSDRQEVCIQSYGQNTAGKNMVIAYKNSSSNGTINNTIQCTV